MSNTIGLGNAEEEGVDASDTMRLYEKEGEEDMDVDEAMSTESPIAVGDEDDGSIHAEQDTVIADTQLQLEAWKEVHARLMYAVGVAREAVAAKKLQRRFWLEEISANLTESGKLATTSVWKRPVLIKKTGKKVAPKPAASASGTKKRKKTAAEPASGTKAKKPRKKKAAESGREETAATVGEAESLVPDGAIRVVKKIRLKLSKTPTAAEEAAAHATADIEESSEEEDDDVAVAQEVPRGYAEDESDGEDEGGRDDEHTDSRYPSHHHHHQQYPNYHHGHWGQASPHGYAHPPGGSPQVHPTSHASPPLHQDQYSGFYGESEGMQSGLSSQEFYSTYSGPPGEEEGTSAPPPTESGEGGNGHEDDDNDGSERDFGF